MNGAYASPCTACGADLAAGLLACPSCARLVHRDRLVELVRAADEAERNGDASAAQRELRLALELLPRATKQHDVLEARIRALAAQVDGRVPASPTPHQAGKLAGLGVVGLALLKSKALLGVLVTNGKLLLVGLTKLPTLLSMLLYTQWSAGQGLSFGVALVASIYVHEVGHVAALRRYGIAASAPMFVPGLGAFVRLKQYPTSAHEDARTGLAGPLWGLGAALIAFLLGRAMDWQVARSVAALGAAINLFNLVPVWQLDGSRGLRALSRGERALLGTGCLAIAVALHNWLPAIIGLVALARAVRARPDEPSDPRVLALFLFLVAAHTILAASAG